MNSGFCGESRVPRGRSGRFAAAVRLCDAGEFFHALPIALPLVAGHGEDARFAFLAGSYLQRLRSSTWPFRRSACSRA